MIEINITHVFIYHSSNYNILTRFKKEITEWLTMRHNRCYQSWFQGRSSHLTTWKWDQFTTKHLRHTYIQFSKPLWTEVTDVLKQFHTRIQLRDIKEGYGRKEQRLTLKHTVQIWDESPGNHLPGHHWSVPATYAEEVYFSCPSKGRSERCRESV